MTESPTQVSAGESGTAPRPLALPELSLVALVGVTGSGKSTFASRHFAPTEVLSSDTFRGLVSDDDNDQSATKDAFEALYFVAGRRLTRRRLTVVDATNVQPRDRQRLVELARAHDVLPVAIVLDVPERVCVARNQARPDRTFESHVVHRQHAQLRKSLKHLTREGFRRVHVLRGLAEIDAATVVRERLFTDLRHEPGPFDAIGDVHGCRSELESLLGMLGYVLTHDAQGQVVGAHHPEGRRAIFLGDLVDRGPDSPGVLRLAMGMVANGDAFVVPGNHENKLMRALRGSKVQISHGLAETLDQLDKEPPEFRSHVQEFIEGLVSHLVLDEGKLVVAHAGLKEAYHNRSSRRVREFAMYGDTTGETDEFGLPVRYPWANDYRGAAIVLYGHVPTPAPEWVNNTMCLDTGCVFGGRLTALRYPERELVSVPAEQVWYEPVKPFLTPDPSAAGDSAHPEQSHGSVTDAPRREPDVLDITDVLGRRVIETTHHGRVSIREENAAGALEVMSRFALDPRWLLYLPPTMAPCATSTRAELLEHPDEAFAAYRSDGVTQVICETKHMGSRAILLVCKDERVARERFGADDGRTGAIYTRTGRSFFDSDLTEQILARVREAAEAAGLWSELTTGWLLLDAELLPWSAKAEDLLRHQYAAVGAAARTALPAAVAALEQSAAAGVDVGELLDRTRSRVGNAEAYTQAYRRYCWPTDGLSGVSVAPFQLLATDGATYADRDHQWHLALADRLAQADPELIRTTPHQVVDVSDPASVESGVRWWESLTAAGGEGMVVKPLANLTRSRRGLVQPGIKVRGREYLRIIYGPDYTEPANLTRLRDRNLGRKRSLALREYALGLEALDRAARGEPLWRVHECVFGVLALESEPVDPRL
ncbi:polynucleotide kinase-phosphatase [Actinopolymorpha alba]|uniref:polynucleotide kinase-phosphatase n=1 Tax=Actinopolymorpha alba TaxID=533267 RepID=UPI00036769DB|nr:polynucleotide kinase-phosphatase [Actinopolymorpha alba]